MRTTTEIVHLLVNVVEFNIFELKFWHYIVVVVIGGGFN